MKGTSSPPPFPSNHVHPLYYHLFPQHTRGRILHVLKVEPLGLRNDSIIPFERIRGRSFPSFEFPNFGNVKEEATGYFEETRMFWKRRERQIKWSFVWRRNSDKARRYRFYCGGAVGKGENGIRKSNALMDVFA